MKIRKPFLTAICVALFFMTLLFAYSYVNSLVSYKYEVEGSLVTRSDREKTLDPYQKEIIGWINESKIEFIGATTLFVIILTVRIAKPSLRGKLQYV